MSLRKAVSIALVISAGVFILGMAYVIVRSLVGTEPVATISVSGNPPGPPRFGDPSTSVSRNGVRALVITTNDSSVPLAVKMRLASTGPATFSAGLGGSLRAARPEVVQEGQEFTLPVGQLPVGRTVVRIYAKTIPATTGPPIVLEQLRIAWEAAPSPLSRVVVWSLLIAGPLFLLLLTIRFAIGPPPDR